MTVLHRMLYSCTHMATVGVKGIMMLFRVQVLFAFMVGIHNLYWYYGSQTYEVLQDPTADGTGGQSKLVHSSEAFRGSVQAHVTR